MMSNQTPAAVNAADSAANQTTLSQSHDEMIRKGCIAYSERAAKRD